MPKSIWLPWAGSLLRASLERLIIPTPRENGIVQRSAIMYLRPTSVKKRDGPVLLTCWLYIPPTLSGARPPKTKVIPKSPAMGRSAGTAAELLALGGGGGGGRSRSRSSSAPKAVAESWSVRQA